VIVRKKAEDYYIQHGNISFKILENIFAEEYITKDYIGKFWIDSLVHDEKAMNYVIDIMGEDKVCLGSDYPFPLGEHFPGSLIESMKFNPDIQDKLLFGNALDWLGIKQIS
jgi:microsomal dipeptidase-like Zn-dependent dipeptidase